MFGDHEAISFVTVVDEAVRVKAAVRYDGAAPHTAEHSYRKAYTALSYRMPSADYGKRAGSPLRDTIAVGSADGPCAPTSAALRQIKLQRFQDSFRSDRALSPLESAQDLIGAVS